MRVNRIPQAMRKRNIQDLIDEQALKARPAPAPTMPVQTAAPTAKVEPLQRQVSKRKSDQISTNDDNDKENRQDPTQDDLPVPKKRAKTAVKSTANTKTTRTVSRKVTAPSNVLSPRSNNSRTFVRSPIKLGVPRPNSPVKPSSNLGAGRVPGSRAPSRQTTKRGAAAPEGRDSEGSNTSAGTTIVRKTTTKKAPVSKKAASTKPAAAGVRKPAAKKDIAAPTVASEGRVLRKRG
nr:hypothetical protein CFP56_10021 [Quercus suber]